MDKIKKIENIGVRQKDSSDCGPACLLSIIRYFGGNAELEELRRLSGTGVEGSSMLGLFEAASKLGLEATGYEGSVEEIKEFADPIILHVNPEPRYEHFIISFGWRKGSFLLWDPAKGFMKMNETELEAIWKSKKCLGIIKSTTFRETSSNNRSKLKWLIKTISPEKDLLIASVIIGVMVAALGIVMALYSQKLIDRILPSSSFKLLVITSCIVLLLLLTRLVLSAARGLFLLIQGRKFNVRIVDAFFRSLLWLPKPFFDSRKTGDFVARLNDTMRIQKVIAEFISVYIIDILIVTITSIMLFVYSPVSGLITIVSLPLIYFTVSRSNKQIIEAQHSVMAGYAGNESNFINSLLGIVPVKSLNWYDFFIQRNREIYSDFQDRLYRLGKLRIWLSLTSGAVSSLYLILLIIFASKQVINKQLTAGELIAIISLSSSVLPSILNLSLINIPLGEAKVAINRMFDFTTIEREGEVGTKDAFTTGIDTISMTNVCFRFPGRGLLLDNIYLTIRKGEIVSLVGESGTGKSTIASLLMRFLEKESGEITINGIKDYSGIELGYYRDRVGIVPQEIHMFNGTLLQNLTTDTGSESLKTLERILINLKLGPFIESLPAGLLTPVGEGGVNLSGGQKQMVGFIRALIKGPDILIIDEGTSAMDRNTESLFTEMINQLRGTMGILLITHRINLIKQLSDRIYVLQDKMIRAEGTHKELLTSDNLYRKFWEDYK